MDVLFWIIAGASLVGVGIAVRLALRTAYAACGRKPGTGGKTGSMLARGMLDAAGLSHIAVASGARALQDRFDPAAGAITLSNRAYLGTDAASHAIAAHEVGHAAMGERRGSPNPVRTVVQRAASALSAAWLLVLLVGALAQQEWLCIAAVLCCAVAVCGRIASLPGEIAASRWALDSLRDAGLPAGSGRAALAFLALGAASHVAAPLVGIASPLERLADALFR